MSNGIGQDFLELINNNPRYSSIRPTPNSGESLGEDDMGADFLNLIKDDPRLNKNPSDAFDEIDEQEQELITEEQLNEIERKNRPGTVKTLKIAKESAGRELNDLGNVINDTVNYLTPVLKESVLMMSLPGVWAQLAMKEDSATRKLGRDMKVVLPEVAKASPQIVREAFKDFFESIGVEKAKETGEFRMDVDVMMDKFREAPLSTVSDYFVVGAIAKKAGQIGLRAISKGAKSASTVTARESFEKGITEEAIEKATKGDKEFIKNMLERMDDGDKAAVASKEIAKLVGSETPTNFGRIFKRKEQLKKIPINKIEDKDFLIKTGNQVKQNLKALELNERGRLAASLSEIGDNTIDSNLLFKKMSQEMSDEFLLSKSALAKKGPIKNKIKGGFKGTIFENLMDDIDSTTTVRELNDMRKRIDQAINFKDPKASDKALRIARDNITSYIKSLDGAEEFARQSSIISERLQPFFDKQKKILKPGGGERFAKSFFSSREEVDDLVDALSKADSIAAQSLKTNIEILDGMNSWNSVFMKNTKLLPEFYVNPSTTILSRGTNAVFGPLKKGFVKGAMNLPISEQAANKATDFSVLSTIGTAGKAKAVSDVFTRDIPTALEERRFN